MAETLTLTLTLLLFSILPLFSSSLPTIGFDSFLSEQFRRDPSASNDSFPLLPSSLKKPLSSLPSPPLSSLSFHLPIPIVLHLVGSFPSISSSLLPSLLISSSSFQTIGATPHHLAISHSLHLEPRPNPSLSSRLSTAIRSHIDSSPSPFHRTALTSVPVSVTDDLIRDDFKVSVSASSAPAYHIYLLKLDPPSRPYAYSYSPGDSSLSFSKCLGSLYAGSDRYLWIDLAAGPVDYGPALSGDGVLPRGEFHPLATLTGRPKSEKALLADLASLISSAYKALLVPSLRIPVFFENSLLIQFVHVHGDIRDPSGLDFGAIEKRLKGSDLVFKDQTLRFRSYSVKYSECPICAFAVTKSTNFYTSRFLFENYTMIVSEYLDSKRLRQILSDSGDEFKRAAGIEDEGYGKVVPVYVFDLDYDKLLMLDRFHQAVAFRDMVIAVRTRSSQTVSDYSCNGRHVITQTRNLERPIVGSVLQSMWGVSPTHLSWSPEHNNTLVDYTWSVGQTPFGPFAESSSLSFAQKDAAKRNVLLTSLNYTISSAIVVLQSMAAHGGDQKLLTKNRHLEFVQRWNFFKHKLDKVIAAMGHLDFEKAMYFLRSSDHDLYQIHTIIYQASQELEASLVCFKDPPFPWASASIAGVFLFGFLYLYAKRDKIFRSKRKQF
ncbi:uncharacterized protein LOC120280672 [Dioscorea cayenensis subsp. rotundata]|uniref:Uncharacterized protein LOC120280672 n=1 Tax=Dioscorea cayennensis subsp. rotundata TaxID=55577 RepID=A0AB40CXI1_DIOCR|nr:uncharacterized protein LOC120280672 [Dioscorea cayenensis subsp. rotundata]